MLKKCTKCGVEKDVSSYGKWALGKDGLKSECRECRSEQSKTYRAANLERIHEQKKQYREVNREELNERSKQQYRQKKYYADANPLTVERLKEVILYTPHDGNLTWLTGQKTGHIAGRIDRTGYRRIRIDNKTYAGHRLAFLYMKGEWPKDQIDHIGKPNMTDEEWFANKSDNRWQNLREATRSQNSANTPRSKNNKVGLKGVYLYPNGKFKTQINIDGKRVSLGYFTDPLLAHTRYCEKLQEIHGEYARVA
jgi:hypothetical protein